jgi:hypothetical protein
MPLEHPQPRSRRPILAVVLAAAAVAASVVLPLLQVASASAHGLSSVAYADLSRNGDGLRAELLLEYDLLVVSVADAQDDDPLYRAGTPAFEDRDDAAMAAALAAHADTVTDYLAERFVVAVGDATCTPTLSPEISMTVREDVPYAAVTLIEDCPPAENGHVVTSSLFPDDEGYVRDTKTILTYDIDGASGSAALDAAQPSFSTEQSVLERFWEFFKLGAEHLLTGIDHILFLLALIAGSRRLREVVLAATAFTIAHSITFILAAVHLVSLPAEIIEPVIALSIAIVAAWYLVRMWRTKGVDPELTKASGPLGLDAAGWLRLGIVFVFGLVHGLGFASALGIEEPWSWTLLWSLLVFNLGIEAVQIGIIAIVFPLLTLLRRRMPRLGLWATVALAVAVTAAGLIWFVQRIFGWE